MAENESATELAARRHLERILRRPLHRVTPDEAPSADYTFDLGEDRVAAVEVKEIVSSDWRHLSAGFEKQETERVTDELRLHWRVVLPGEIAAERLVPVPGFPADDQERIAALEAQGYGAVRRAERVAEFESRREESPAPLMIKGLIDALVPDLQVLEDRGIRTTRGDIPADEEGSSAWWRIDSRTRGAICTGGEARPEAGMPAGVFLVLSYGYTRTGRADTITDRIDAWLSTKRRKLIEALSRSEYSERHAVLVFDSTEPELRSSEESNSFVPSRGLALPPEVDILWVVLGSRVLHYSLTDGWKECVPEMSTDATV